MALQQDILDLQRNALLACFDVEALRLIAFNTDSRNLSKGDILFRQGEPADGGYFIQEGSMVLTSDETEQVHRAGSLLGETALLIDTTRPATATALENVSVRRIPRHLVQRILSEYPDTLVRVTAYLKHGATELERGLRRLDALLPQED